MFIVHICISMNAIVVEKEHFISSTCFSIYNIAYLELYIIILCQKHVENIPFLRNTFWSSDNFEFIVQKTSW